MNETKPLEVPNKGFLGFKTQREDLWWLEPAMVAVGFGLFIIYATFRAFENNYYEVLEGGRHYLSPFYSPRLNFDWWQWSPAILILWIPAGFRATCYYYRKAYYRSYFLTPPACGVSGYKSGQYCGETSFPFVLQNIHRYMFYLASLVLLVLWYDTYESFRFGEGFGVGVGSLIFLANVLLLSGYTFGCHAFRHLVGGRLDCFSCTKSTQAQLGVWSWVSKLNEKHMLWAWLSLFSVGFADFYVRCVATGVIKDIQLIP